ncbi:MAG: methyltransferase domain-containing protein [Treponema sp.]|nr:methyltransferase domain-containing protein [Treponema sp.]
MEYFQNLVEYFDEFFLAEQDVCEFIKKVASDYPKPGKLLQIASGSGSLALSLSKNELDVTGLETSQPLLTSATLKRRTQLLSIRFFKLSILEMSKFLGKGFYNVIFCLNNRIAFIRNEETMQQFFNDCKMLLSENGKLILQLYNYEKFIKKTAAPADKKSPRATLSTNIRFSKKGTATINQYIENGQSKAIPVLEEEPIFPLTKAKITEFAGNAGFKKVDFYKNFKKDAYSDDSDELVCIIA